MSIENKLNKLDRFGIKLGLDNELKVLEYLNNPHEHLNIIHIAGTNGKGSTLAILEACLLASKKNVCKYTSPYLISPLEMFVYNNKQFKEEELIVAYDTVIDAQKKVNITLTRYEVTTVMMFLLAKKVGCDWLLLETGMGGRLDATNVVNAKYSLITNISMDHMNLLGNTLEDIATEKVGIIKEYGYIGEEIKELNDILQVRNIKYIITNKVSHTYNLDISNMRTIINVNEQEFIVPLYGIHQVNNFLLAYKILKDLRINDRDIVKGLENIVWKARMEMFSKEPLIIYDGAHNESAALNLVESLGTQKFDIYYSTFKDKEYLKIFEVLKKIANDMYYVELSDDRSLKYEDFKQSIHDESIIVISQEDFPKFIENTKTDTLICGTLNLYKYLKRGRDATIE